MAHHSLEGLIEKQIKISKNKFGTETRTSGIIDHMVEELKEIENNPNDIFEWIDMLILSIDGSWRRGFTPSEIAEAWKQKIDIINNRKYENNPDPNKRSKRIE